MKLNQIKTVDKLHKSINRKLQNCKEYSFIDNIWNADLAGMQLSSKYNKRIRFLCVINIFIKYAWAIPLKDKKVKQSLKHYKNVLKNQVLNQKRYWQIKIIATDR